MAGSLRQLCLWTRSLLCSLTSSCVPCTCLYLLFWTLLECLLVFRINPVEEQKHFAFSERDFARHLPFLGLFHPIPCTQLSALGHCLWRAGDPLDLKPACGLWTKCPRIKGRNVTPKKEKSAPGSFPAAQLAVYVSTKHSPQKGMCTAGGIAENNTPQCQGSCTPPSGQPGQEQELILDGKLQMRPDLEGSALEHWRLGRGLTFLAADGSSLEATVEGQPRPLRGDTIR
ncbi:uncharacterized protein LOC109500091 [Felis catus]|uniref:uncharacterized protein LOC109500091 n=1 Tax=Felis catus TaxID=9685 RepID=UPI001D1A0975|nr:uncharacterized protein LOC109500091 [Felis catus]